MSLSSNEARQDQTATVNQEGLIQTDFEYLQRIVLSGSNNTITRISTLLATLSLIGLIAVAGLSLIDIALRSTVSGGIPGLFELNGLFVAIIISGFMSLVFVERRNIHIDIMSKLAGSNQLAVKLISSLLGSIVIVGFAVVLGYQTLDSYQYEETTTVLGVATVGFWFSAFLIAAFGAFLAAINCLLQWGRLIVTKFYTGKGFWRGFNLMVGALVITFILLWAFLDENASSGVQASIAFIALYILISVQIPVGVSLGILGMLSLGFMLDYGSASLVAQNEVVHAITSLDMVAIPLFLLMGNFATWAGLSGDVFNSGTAMVGSRRGGLVIASVMGCGIFGAISGSSIATTATFGKVAFTEMEKRNYAKSLAAGCIAAGGTLGALIPPSVVLIVYCIVVEESIQVAFQAALLPGLLALCMYIIAIVITVRIKPELAPEPEKFDAAVARKSLINAWRPILLFTMVLGGLYGGIFTTQEAASVGAMLAFFFALATKDFNKQKFKDSLVDTAINSGAIYVIFIGANIFASFMSFSDVAGLILSLVDIATTPHWIILLALVIFYLLLGTVFDTLAAILVTTPLIVPLIVGMDYDLIWWGIVTLSLVEIGMITPPLGMNVFVMRSVVGERLQLTTIFKGVIPFLIADLFRVVLLVIFPAISLWLPEILK